MLKGKQGRFRQNLLGKRVDYSGRSVIVVGPELKLHQCGLPKAMAVELFKPFIIHELERRGEAETVKRAKKIVEQDDAKVYEVLEDIIRDHPVLLNRAPTLHRLGIQAFEPVLVEGKAIRVHPLVCAAFNADFDGDQMAVHLPLSFEAQLEARVLMLSSNNVLLPSNGRPVAAPTQDMVIGAYYLTKAPLEIQDLERVARMIRRARRPPGRKPPRRTGTVFAGAPRFGTYGEVEMALGPERPVPRPSAGSGSRSPPRTATGAGRPGVDSDHRGPGALQLDHPRRDRLPELHLRKAGARRPRLRVLHRGGAGPDHGVPRPPQGLRLPLRHDGRGERRNRRPGGPAREAEILRDAEEQVARFQRAYSSGFISNGERYNKVIDTWTHANNDVADAMVRRLERSKDGFNPVYMMMVSGARGNRDQMRQLAGMRGLMAKPQKKLTGGIGEIIESPIKSNFREGLSVVEYFISTHGARKGLADTALKTADAGYLTRRLVDVAQDVTVTEEDCGTILGLEMTALKEGEDIIEPLKDRIVGNVALEDVVDPLDGELIVEAPEVILEARGRDRGGGDPGGEDPFGAHL
jgi:DNA-directed RNA polymerase subunit beta'